MKMSRAASFLSTQDNLNDPTQSEHIAVSCSDWIGSFFACSPCISRGTGVFDFGCLCHWSGIIGQNPSAKRENGGSRTPADITHISFRHCDSWLSLLLDIAFGFSMYDVVAEIVKFAVSTHSMLDVFLISGIINII